MNHKKHRTLIITIRNPLILQALNDYDRRSRTDRTQKAHQYAQELLQDVLGAREGGSRREQPPAVGQHVTLQQQSQGGLQVTEQELLEHGAQHRNSPGHPAAGQEPPEVGEAVAVVQADSTVTSPKLWIGRCVKVEGEQVVVTPFSEIATNSYVLKVGGGKQRVPLRDLVYPIDFVHCCSANTYQLRTKKTQIHLCLSPLL